MNKRFKKIPFEFPKGHPQLEKGQTVFDSFTVEVEHREVNGCNHSSYSLVFIDKGKVKEFPELDKDMQDSICMYLAMEMERMEQKVKFDMIKEAIKAEIQKQEEK